MRAKSDDFAHRMFYSDADFAVLDRVLTLAERRNVTPAQIALAWLLHQPSVVAPIIGASKPHHLEEAVTALEIDLSSQECTYLEEVYQPHPVLGIEVLSRTDETTDRGP